MLYKSNTFYRFYKKYIYDTGYDTGIDDEEIQWEIVDFKAHYPHTWWTVEQINYND